MNDHVCLPGLLSADSAEEDDMSLFYNIKQAFWLNPRLYCTHTQGIWKIDVKILDSGILT